MNVKQIGFSIEEDPLSILKKCIGLRLLSIAFENSFWINIHERSTNGWNGLKITMAVHQKLLLHVLVNSISVPTVGFGEQSGFEITMEEEEHKSLRGRIVQSGGVNKLLHINNEMRYKSGITDITTSPLKYIKVYGNRQLVNADKKEQFDSNEIEGEFEVNSVESLLFEFEDSTRFLVVANENCIKCYFDTNSVDETFIKQNYYRTTINTKDIELLHLIE